MEVHIIVALCLTILILRFAIWREREDISQRVDSQVKALQAEISRLEGVRRVLIKDSQSKDKSVVSYRRSPPDLPSDNSYWTDLSDWLRKEKNWTCEKCGINLEKRGYDLHVHHVFGRGFNSPQHLEVLCRQCHAEEPGHGFMKAYPEYKAFLEWKKGRTL